MSVTNTFTVTVNESNRPPVLTLPANQTINELTSLNTNATATDPDFPANALTFALVSGPGGLTVSSSGTINWTPGEADGPGTNIVFVKVSDSNPSAINANSLSVTSSFQIVVNERNVAPVPGPIADRTVNPGQMISFTATATDADLPTNGLSFSLVNPPVGATISGGGAFQWRPSVAQADTTNQVFVRVEDNGSPALSGTNSFMAVVNPLSPVLLTPLSFGGGAFTFQVSGTTGPDYFIMASTNLTDWLDIGTNLSAVTPFQFNDAAAGTFTNRSYRVRLGP